MTAPTKPVNPYARLFEEFKKFLGSVRHPKRTKMAWWGSASVGNMNGEIVYQRTLAAQQLGMKVEVVADGEGLHFWYVSKPDEDALPWRLR